MDEKFNQKRYQFSEDRSDLWEISEDLIEKIDNLPEYLPEYLPEFLREKVLPGVEDLKALLVNRRCARFAVIGRRGSGKSSFINALFNQEIAKVGHETSQTGAAQWYEYQNEYGKIEILDTRGLQEGSKPKESDQAKTPLESIKGAIDDTPPDVLVFMIKAKEVDAAIEGDLKALCEIAEYLKDKYGSTTPILGILTHCDQIEPQYVDLSELQDFVESERREKLEGVEKVKSHLLQQIEKHKILKNSVLKTFGVCLYQSWDAEGNRRADKRWNVNELATYMVEQLPNEAQLDFVRLVRIKEAQKKIANRLKWGASWTAAGLGAAPMPGADIIPITSLQVGLVMSIGYVGGHGMNKKTARDFLAAAGLNAGAGFALREIARGLVQFVPGWGQYVSGSVAFAATFAIGEVATSYFIGGNTEDLESQFEEAYEKGKSKASEEGIDEDEG